jgi:prepilin peptidase CpaA
MGWDTILAATLPAVLALILVSAGIEDARIREIADAKNIAIALLAPLWWWASGMALWPDVAIQLGVAAVVFGLFAAAFAVGLMGGGDVKMIAALALWFPFPLFSQFLVAMSLAGGAVTLAMMADRWWRRRETIEVPYGVAIAVAGLICLGEPILNHSS